MKNSYLKKAMNKAKTLKDKTNYNDSTLENFYNDLILELKYG